MTDTISELLCAIEQERKLVSVLRAIQHEARKQKPNPDKIYAWATEALGSKA